jgi:hypothetical protein
VIGTRGLRAELARRVDMAAATSGEDHAGRQCARRLRLRVNALIAELTLRLAGIAGKGFRFPCGSSPFRPGWCSLAAAPQPTR